MDFVFNKKKTLKRKNKVKKTFLYLTIKLYFSISYLWKFFVVFDILIINKLCFVSVCWKVEMKKGIFHLKYL